MKNTPFLTIIPQPILLLITDPKQPQSELRPVIVPYILINKNPVKRNNVADVLRILYRSAISNSPNAISTTGKNEINGMIKFKGNRPRSSIIFTAFEGSIIFVIPEKINTIPRIILTTLTLFTNSP